MDANIPNLILQLENQSLFPGRMKAQASPINWSWERGQNWVILGDNGSGKTRFLEFLETQAGGRARSVSFEGLERIISQQIRLDDSNFLGYRDTGTPLFRFLGHESPAQAEHALPQGSGMSELLSQGIRVLSTGEMRRALIYQAVLSHPEILMLDEPFDGLDVAARKDMVDLVSTLIRQGLPVLMFLNRKSELLPEHSHVAVFKDNSLDFCGTRNDWEQYNARHTGKDRENLTVPGPPGNTAEHVVNCPLVAMRDVTVRYGDKTILDRVSWQVQAGEHWKISGPNGAGKTTLLNLISGDNPQAYCNDISLFGRRRGSGETVWDIKSKVGIVSPELQLNYRVSASARLCILSGLFDSIGVYQPASRQQEDLVSEWLEFLKMSDRADQPLRQFSYGEQRMLLIARGLIKHPPLLILDEPCQGLDDDNRQRVLQMLGAFAQGGESTLLYVTHQPEDEVQNIRRHLEFVPSGHGFTLRESGL